MNELNERLAGFLTFLVLFPLAGLAVTLGLFILWVSGLIHCLCKRHDKDRIVWVLVTLLGGPVGAVIYFIFGRTVSQEVRYSPRFLDDDMPPKTIAPATPAPPPSDGEYFDRHGLEDPGKRAASISAAVWRDARSRKR